MTVRDESNRFEIEGILQQNPEDLESWAVLGDLLQNEGQLRGELIALDLCLRKNPADQLCKNRRDLLFDSLRSNALELHSIFEFEGGENLYGPNQILEWEFGFIRSARIHGPFGLNKGRVEDVLESLLNSESARFLRTLELSTAPPDQNREGDLRECIRILADNGPFPALRELSLGRASDLRGSVLGPLDQLFKALPNLQFLSLSGIDSHLEDFSLTRLREIRLHNKALGPEILRSMGQADLSRLAVLHFNLEHGNLSKAMPVAGTGGPLGYYQLVIQPETLRNFKLLFDNPTIRNLKSLQLQFCEWGGELLKLLKGLPLLGQAGGVKNLDLTGTGISDSQAQPLLDSPELFLSLESLNLSRNNISETTGARLKELYGERINLSNQWEASFL